MTTPQHEFIYTNILEKAKLGMDFLKKYEAIFDFDKNAISLSDESIHMKFTTLTIVYTIQKQVA